MDDYSIPPLKVFKSDGTCNMVAPSSKKVDHIDLLLLESRLNEEIFSLKTQLAQVLEIIKEKNGK